jgi:hypothetical protein
MKRIFKVISIFLLSLIIIVIGLLIWTKYFLANNWKKYYTETEIKVITDSINKSPSFTNDFYSAYELIHPNMSTRKLSEMENSVIWSILTFNKKRLNSEETCNCLIIAEQFENQFPHKFGSFSWLMLANGIEQNSSEIKCLDYLYSNNKFLANLSIEQFGKEINELSFEESVKFFVLEKSPTRYRNNPELFESEVKNI